MRTFFAFCVAFICSQTLIAQEVEIIEVDTLTQFPKKSVPFDKSFFLKIKMDEKPVFIHILKNKGKKSWYETITSRLGPGKSFEFTDIPEEMYSIKEEDAMKFLYVRFGEVKSEYIEICDTIKGVIVCDYKQQKKKNTFLEPSSNYTLIYPKLYNSALSLIDSLHANKDAFVETEIKKIQNLQKRNLGLIYFVPDLDTLKAFYQDSLKFHYDSISTLSTSLDLGLEHFKNLQNSIVLKKSVISLLQPRLLETLKVYVNPNELFKIIHTIQSSTESQLKDFLSGSLKIIKPHEKQDFDAQVLVENLDKNINELKKLDTLIDLLVDEGGLKLDSGWFFANGENYLDYVFKQFEANKSCKKQLASHIAKIKLKTLEQNFFLEPLIVTGTSQIFNFETRSKLQITPDFGYTVYGLQKGFTGFSPYLGFHINFRSIDKDIPFSRYPNKTFLHYLSFMTAWSLTKIDEENKRENFFEAGALITGIGIRLTNALKFAVGNYWLYKLDPRKEIPGRKLAITPFVGLSIDLSLKSLMNDITSLKPTK